jgi:hypothetical protein
MTLAFCRSVMNLPGLRFYRFLVSILGRRAVRRKRDELFLCDYPAIPNFDTEGRSSSYSFLQLRTKNERCKIRFLEECVPPVTASRPTLVLGGICGVAALVYGGEQAETTVNPLS